ncbi:MAG: MBL fold metallo-hydrolase [Bacillota bacterium]
MASRKRRLPVKVTGVLLLLVILTMLTLFAGQTGLSDWWAGRAVTPAAGELAVHFIDVGQGDAILIQAPAQNVLIDGGPRGAGVDLASYLHQCGVNRLDLVVSTHPHDDHIGGLLEVLDKMPVDEVMDPAVAHTTQTFEKYLALIDEKNIRFTTARAGLSRDLGGGAVLSLLHPVAPQPDDGLNNCSVVLRLTFGRVSFLMTGDVEQAAERAILEREGRIRSTVLKVAHHGSRSSSDSLFLDAVKPAVAVICYGDNQYGVPHQETVQYLAETGALIYSTFEHGTVMMITDGNTYTVHTGRP